MKYEYENSRNCPDASMVNFVSLLYMTPVPYFIWKTLFQVYALEGTGVQSRCIFKSIFCPFKKDLIFLSITSPTGDTEINPI